MHEMVQPIPQVVDLPAASMQQAFRRYASSVMLLAYLGPDGKAYGMTATSVCSVSIDPPIILACINRRNRSHPEILRSKRFSISMLSHHQSHISEFCAKPGAVKQLPESWLATVGRDVPVVRDAVAAIQCQLSETVEAGSHSVVFGAVNAVELGPENNPLLYFGGAYRSIRDVEEESSCFVQAGIIW